MEKSERNILEAKIDAVDAKVDANFAAMKAAMEASERRMITFLEGLDRKIDASVARLDSKIDQVIEGQKMHAEQMERMDRKIDLVIEGQQMHAEHMERMESELKGQDIPKLDRRVTTVAADLSSHKSDPEAHRHGFSVKEGESGYGDEPEDDPETK